MIWEQLSQCFGWKPRLCWISYVYLKRPGVLSSCPSWPPEILVGWEIGFANDCEEKDNKKVMMTTVMMMMRHLLRSCSWGLSSIIVMVRITLMITTMVVRMMTRENMKMMLMVITMMNKILHLLRPCSWGTLDEATLQHGSPTVHNLYVLPMMMVILKSCLIWRLFSNHHNHHSHDDADSHLLPLPADLLAHLSSRLAGSEVAEPTMEIFLNFYARTKLWHVREKIRKYGKFQNKKLPSRSAWLLLDYRLHLGKIKLCTIILCCNKMVV